MSSDSPAYFQSLESPESVVSSIMATPRTPRSQSIVPGGSRSPQYLLEMIELQTPPNHVEDSDMEFTPSTPEVMAIARNIDVSPVLQ